MIITNILLVVNIIVLICVYIMVNTNYKNAIKELGEKIDDVKRAVNYTVGVDDKMDKLRKKRNKDNG